MGGGRKLNRNLPETEGNVFRTICRDAGGKEAYCCTFPSFVDCCSLTARRQGRRGVNGVLMLLTLAEKEKKGLMDESERLNQMMLLRKVLSASLRRRDIYTRCGNRHYVLMLSGIEQEMCGAVFRRIEDQYNGMEDSTGRLFWQIIKMKENENISQGIEKIGGEQ